MTQAEIDALIEKVNKHDSLAVENIYWDRDSQLTDVEFETLIPYFDKLTVKAAFIDNSWRGDIYSDLAELKNLSQLYFYYADLIETEKFIEDGLLKLKYIDILGFYSCKIKKFPNSIFKLKHLQNLPIFNSFDNLPNIHFYRKNHKIDLAKVFEKVFQQNSNTIDYESFYWGFKFQEFIIILNSASDEFMTIFDENIDCDVYFLNPEKIYQSYQTAISVFKEVDSKLDCFEKENNELRCTTIYDGELISVYELKQRYSIGEKKYKDFFIDKLLKNVGGEGLLAEIRNEGKKEQARKTLQFDEKNKHIESIKISNFKLFNTLTINKLDKINIIVGKNGCGKTSLLQAIALGLIPQHSTDWIPTQYGYNYLNSLINSRTQNDDIYSEIILKWSQFESNHRLYKDSFLAEQELPHTYLALGYGENLFTNPQTGADIFMKDLAEGEGKTYSIETLFNNYNTTLPNPLEILNYLNNNSFEQYPTETKLELKEIGKILLETLNRFLSLQPIDNYRIEKTDFSFHFIDKKGTKLTLYQISEGYRTNIVLLTDVLIRIVSARKKLFVKPVAIENIFQTVKGTILIDEFDKHLHPVWQRTFLSALESELPNIQFFLTTHNVVALQSAEGHKALILNENGEVESKQIPVGYSIEALYKEFFGNQFFSNEVTAKIAKLKEYRNEMIQTKNFKPMDSPESEFNKLRIELLNKSYETALFAQNEYNQLRKLKENAETKTHKKTKKSAGVQV